MQLWQINNAEQMILDDVEANPNKYKGKRLSELTDEEEIDEENSIEYGKAKYKNTTVPRVTLVIIFSFCYLSSLGIIYVRFSHSLLQKLSVKELDLEAALAERQVCLLFIITISTYKIKFICLIIIN